LLINQIKDKVENIGKEIESKKEDINSNDIQMSELKAELSALLTKCEELYKEYDVQRTSVLELKYNRKMSYWLTKVMALPERPALAVLPTRWM